jgi:hypothetical protein
MVMIFHSYVNVFSEKKLRTDQNCLHLGEVCAVAVALQVFLTANEVQQRKSTMNGNPQKR